MREILHIAVCTRSKPVGILIAVSRQDGGFHCRYVWSWWADFYQIG